MEKQNQVVCHAGWNDMNAVFNKYKLLPTVPNMNQGLKMKKKRKAWYR